MNKQILVGLTVDAMISNLSHKSFNFEDQIKKEALFFVNNPSINLILKKKKKKKIHLLICLGPNRTAEFHFIHTKGAQRSVWQFFIYVINVAVKTSLIFFD